MTGHRIDLPEMPVGSKFTGEYIDGGVKIEFGEEKQQMRSSAFKKGDYIFWGTDGDDLSGIIIFDHLGINNELWFIAFISSLGSRVVFKGKRSYIGFSKDRYERQATDEEKSELDYALIMSGKKFNSKSLKLENIY